MLIFIAFPHRSVSSKLTDQKIQRAETELQMDATVNTAPKNQNENGMYLKVDCYFYRALYYTPVDPVIVVRASHSHIDYLHLVDLA